MAEEAMSNFVGLKYTSGDLDQGTACLKSGRSVFLGAATVLCGALALGFDSSIMTIHNICPELPKSIVELMQTDRLADARLVQQALTSRVLDIQRRGGDWVPAMKAEFNRHNPALFAGSTRKPLHDNKEE